MSNFFLSKYIHDCNGNITSLAKSDLSSDNILLLKVKSLYYIFQKISVNEHCQLILLNCGFKYEGISKLHFRAFIYVGMFNKFLKDYPVDYN